MQIPNNQDKVAKQVNDMFLKGHGIEAVGDDGSVCVQISGIRSAVILAARSINDKFGHLRIGDGVQEGSIFINGDDCDIHDELDAVVRLDF